MLCFDQAHCPYLDCSQVDGCGKDLAGLSSKSYMVRHKCCADHLRACTVTVAGVLSRWGLSCAKFHSLNEFDGTKKSCRKRLSQHNARRRR
ncbi:squamosa promoter binding protein, partial [Haematococcus lacustris]